MKSHIEKIRRNYSDYGLSVTIKKVFKELLHPIYLSRKYRIYVADLKKVDIPPIHHGTYTFRKLRPDETVIIKTIEAMEEWLRNQVAERIRNGAVCIIALDGEQLAGFNLISFDDIYIPLINRRKTMGKHEAWSDQITVSKQYRGKGLGKTIRYAAMNRLREMNIKMFYGGTLSDNHPSLGLARSVGFQEILEVKYCKILGKKIWKNRKVTHGIDPTH